MHHRRSALWGLDPDVTHLNHGSFGATPLAVMEYQRALQRHIESDPMAFMLEELQGELNRCREILAAFVNGDPAAMAFVPNTTHGVNTVLRSLRFAPGDEILILDHAYEACRNAVAYVAERSGASVVVVDLPDPVRSGGEVIERIVAAVTPNTRLAVVDHVTSSSALVLDIAEIVAELRMREVTTLVDGAHAPGMVDVDLDSIDADVYVANCHKWLCAPKGAAFLHAAPAMRDALVPLSVSFGLTSTGMERSRFHAQFDWTGTNDPTPFLSVPSALEAVGGAIDGGWAGVMAHNHELVTEGAAVAAEALGSEVTAPPEMLGSMVAIPLQDLPGGIDRRDPLETYLRDEHGIVAPVTPGPRRGQRWLRVSAQIYNDESDFEHLAKALTAWRSRSGVAG